MMKRIFLGLLCSLVFLTGCQQEKNSLRKLEEYEEEETTEFQFMEEGILKGPTLTLKVPVLKDSTIEGERSTGEKYGVTVDTELLEDCVPVDKIQQIYTEYETYETEGSIQDLEISDLLEEDDYGIVEIRYDIQSGSVTYPCAVYIKLDQLTGGGYLKTTIEIDNSKADENSAQVVKEVMDAYHIVIEKKEEA